MCGIVGILSRDQRQVEPAVRRVMHAMRHRGLDDEGYNELPLGWDRLGRDQLGRDTDDGAIAGFGFRRLSIIDLSPAGHQPMFNQATGDCLIFNGEIYNFRCLRSELENCGITFAGSSDSEVLLHALSTWGEAAFDKLQGMYAFAFYEARSQRILLARDPLGIKPLYVAQLPDRFIFASEIRAILASGMVSDDLDVGGIAGMLAYGAVQSPRTVFQHIRSFPAGCFQWIDSGAAAGHPLSAAKRHWSFPRHILADDRSTAVATLGQMLHDSVHRHLVADVPVGVLLSAGIDSTILATIAQEYSPQVTAFTIGFGGLQSNDEGPLATATAALLGIKHVLIELDASKLSEKWSAWMQKMDSPSVDGFNTYAVSRGLARAGIVVGLSGLGADELFGGYPSFRRSDRWSQLLEAIWFIPPSLRSSVVAGLGAISGRNAAAEKMIDLLSGDPTVTGIAHSLRRLLSNRHLQTLGLSAHSVGLANDYLPSGSDCMELALDGDRFNAVSRVEMTNYMGDTLLRDTDTTSMHNGLEIRVPFLDLPVVQYVSGLSGAVKRQGNGPPKPLLREAFSHLLSPTIRKRLKTGFTLPIGEWMRGQLRESCDSAIQQLDCVPCLDQNEVQRIWQSFQQTGSSMHYSRPLALVVLGNYLKVCRQSSREPMQCVESQA